MERSQPRMSEYDYQYGKFAVRVREIQCKSALTPTCGFLGLSYTHSLNPYNGCLFGNGGCGIYCYAQKVYPAISKHPGEGWGSWVDVKVNAAEVLRSDLGKARRKGEVIIYMSSITDPFQPLESRYGISKACLLEMDRQPPDALVLQTRSPSVIEVFGLLKRISNKGTNLSLNITIETDDEEMRKRLMPVNPGIQSRLELCRSARSQGIFTQVTVSPMLPSNPKRFAELLDAVADRVIVDTFFLGDGSKGSRSMHLPVYQMLNEMGEGRLFEPIAHQELLETFRQVLGEERVLLSRYGFNTLD